MSREGYVKLGVTGVVALLTAGSVCQRGQSPPADAGAAPRDVAPSPRDAAPPPPPRAGVGTRVIVDVSQSMAGFTGRRRRALSALHVQVIEHAVSELRANERFQRCALDEALRCGAEPMSGAALDRAETYTGRAAALDLALRRPEATSDPARRVDDPLDPFAITVLVTDGFQSAHASGGAAGDALCAAGADPACVGHLLAARVREGYGVWLGRLYLPFKGTYYPERPLDDAIWERVQAHVAELGAANSGWDDVHFEARRRGREGESGAFQWEGARAMLLFVLSRDHAKGRALVTRMQEALRSETTLFPRGADADAAFAELAPFEGLAGQVAPGSVARRGGGPGVDAVVVDGTARVPGAALTTAHCSLEGAADVTTGGSVALGALAPPRFVEVTAAWRLSGPAAEGATLVSPREAVRVWPAAGAAPGSPFPATWRVDCRRIAPGTHEHRFGVHVAWRLDDSALAAEWYMRESAETSYESPERVFRLRQMVLPVLQTSTARRGWLDQWVLRLTRR